MSFNKIIIVGNLGRDPEMRYTPQGTPVCNFSIATNERRKDRAGELQDITTWFKVTVWGKQAETASKYLTKGKSVYIEGRLHVEEWTDKEGKPRQTLEVNASDMHFIDSAGGGGGGDREGEGGGGSRSYDQTRSQGAGGQGGAGSQGGAARGAAAQPSSGAAIEDDDIPF